ncbi:RNA polymerase sigma factor [Mucilaginibacter sp.]|uniref:RNA polymerase sigma factor n=1 Tax=Mucilaginibacter sp. TaxID=1882438 RepID=UPI0035BC90FF
MSNQKPVGIEQLIMRLYQTAFPAVARYVSKMGGSFDDSKDIFQDALVIYYEKAVVGNLGLKKADEQAYILGTARHLWLRKFSRDKGNMPLLDGFDVADEQENEVSATRLMHYLQTAGKKCMELLSAFYYDKLPMRDIAGLFGFTGERSATVQKYKCLEKVRETVKQNALAYEDFVA